MIRYMQDVKRIDYVKLIISSPKMATITSSDSGNGDNSGDNRDDVSTPRLPDDTSVVLDIKTSFEPLFLYTDKWSLDMISIFHKCTTRGFPIPVYPGVLLSHLSTCGSLGEKLDQIAYHLKNLEIDLSSPFFHHVWYRLNGVVRTRLSVDIERTPSHQKVIEFMVAIGVIATAFEIVSSELQKISYTVLTKEIYDEHISKFLKSNFKIREIGALVSGKDVYYLTASKLEPHAAASLAGSMTKDTPLQKSNPTCLIYLNNKSCTDHISAWKTIKRALDDGWLFKE